MTQKYFVCFIALALTLMVGAAAQGQADPDHQLSLTSSMVGTGETTTSAGTSSHATTPPEGAAPRSTRRGHPGGRQSTHESSGRGREPSETSCGAAGSVPRPGAV